VARAADPDKQKAITVAVSSIEKQFGKGAILSMTEDSIDREVETFSSGSVSIDLALGVGGYPRGRVIEIYGPESSGKTTLSLHAVAEIQRAGGVAAFIDAEHALDIGYARRLGVRVEDLLVSQPDTGEQALEIVDVLLRSGAIDLVVVDSVAALTPRAEIEGEMGDHHVGLQARLMSQALRKLTSTVSKSRGSVIFINQIRMKIGVMFGNPETTTGGNALKFYSSIRLDVRRIAALKDGRSPRSRHRLRHRGEERLLVLLRRRTHRSGSGERAPVPSGEPGCVRATRGRGLRRQGHQTPGARREPGGRRGDRSLTSWLERLGKCPKGARSEAQPPKAEGHGSKKGRVARALLGPGLPGSCLSHSLSRSPRRIQWRYLLQNRCSRARGRSRGGISVRTTSLRPLPDSGRRVCSALKRVRSVRARFSFFDHRCSHGLEIAACRYYGGAAVGRGEGSK
jgi:protein RecA